MRGRFFRRIGCALALLFFFFILVTTVIIWLSTFLAEGVPHPTGWIPILRPVGFLVGLAVFIGLIYLARTLRRAAIPMGNLLDAAGRIEAGDFSTRVEESGPEEVRAVSHAFNNMAAGLQLADERRRDFLADITHELRTPITVIQGNLEGILDGIYPADSQRIQSILDETRLLSRSIDDLRTVALAEAGGLKLQREPIDLGELVKDFSQSYLSEALKAGIQLKTNISEKVLIVEVDPTRIREVLTNLVTNAMRYTPAGGGIELHTWADSGDPNKVWISVRDTGKGIFPENLPHLFERFYKSSDSHGTGLGLAISKSLVNAHGGEISAQSKPGEGTTITFWLPTTENHHFV